MKLTEQKLSIKSILLITILLPVLVIALSSVAIVITAKSVQPQDTVSPDFLSKTTYVISAEPKNEEDALTLVSKLFSAAIKTNALKYSKSTSATVESIKCDNESVQELFLFTKGSLEDNFRKFYEDEAIRYGENADAILTVLPGSTPGAAECKIGEDKIMELTLTYDTVFNNMYFLSDDTVAIKMFTTENAGVFSVINEKFIPTLCEYKLTADTVTGKIISFTVASFCSNACIPSGSFLADKQKSFPRVSGRIPSFNTARETRLYAPSSRFIFVSSFHSVASYSLRIYAIATSSEVTKCSHPKEL